LLEHSTCFDRKRRIAPQPSGGQGRKRVCGALRDFVRVTAAGPSSNYSQALT